MIRVVADTNIWVSALIFGGKPKDFFTRAEEAAFVLFSSPQLLDELNRTLSRKFAFPNEELLKIRRKFTTLSRLVVPREAVSFISADPDDDRVLECAVAAGAHFIVTGDRHLLHLGSYNNIAIVTVRDFLDRPSASASILA